MNKALTQFCWSDFAALRDSVPRWRLGFDVIFVDKIVTKSPKVIVTELDLTQSATQQLVL